MRGGVAEWPKVRHWKCRVGATLPWVRIPPPPPLIWLRVVREIPQSTPIGEKGPVASRLRVEIAGRAVRRRVHGHSATGGSASCRSSPVLPPTRTSRPCRGVRAVTYQVLARKWRPQVFAGVVGQDAVTRTLQNALASGRVAHAYLFTGPRGVGKTTTARLLAK